MKTNLATKQETGLQEVSQAPETSALSSLPVDLTSLSAMASRRPRDPRKAIESAIIQLEVMPEFAAKSYYVIPFKNKDGSTSNVEGPSIKAAMALAQNWGNNINGTFIGSDTPDYVDVCGYYLDTETGMLTVRNLRVLKFQKYKDGSVYKLSEDKLGRAIQAGSSKAVRNAILPSLPVGLVEEYYQSAKRIAASGKTRKDQKPLEAKERLEKMYLAFKKLGVEKPALDRYIATNLADEDGESIIAHMLGIFNAINDKEARVEDVFVEPPKEQAKGAMTMDDIIGEPK